MSGWTLRVVWPIEDPQLFDWEAIEAARRDLPNVAADSNAIIAGPPTFRVVQCNPDSWPATATAVVCEVPALPAVARIATHTERNAA